MGHTPTLVKCPLCGKTTPVYEETGEFTCDCTKNWYNKSELNDGGGLRQRQDTKRAMDLTRPIEPHIKRYSRQNTKSRRQVFTR